jgi:hypothetical protein
VGTAIVLVGVGTGAGVPGAGQLQAVTGLPGGTLGTGTGVADPPVAVGVAVRKGTGVGFLPGGTGTGVAAHAGAVGTGTGTADEAGAGPPGRLATGVAARGVAAPATGGAPLGVPVAGLLTVALAAFAAPDAAWPEPDAAAEQPARARLAAIPIAAPAATRAVLLSDRTCMLLEVVDTNTGKYVGTCGKLCSAGSNLSPPSPV